MKDNMKKANRWTNVRLLYFIPCHYRWNHDFCDRILYIPVPHAPHLPLMAGRPFFIVTRWVSTIKLFLRHLTQYAISPLSAPAFPVVP